MPNLLDKASPDAVLIGPHFHPPGEVCHLLLPPYDTPAYSSTSRRRSIILRLFSYPDDTVSDSAGHLTAHPSVRQWEAEKRQIMVAGTVSAVVNISAVLAHGSSAVQLLVVKNTSWPATIHLAWLERVYGKTCPCDRPDTTYTRPLICISQQRPCSQAPWMRRNDSSSSNVLSAHAPGSLRLANAALAGPLH